MLLLELVYVVQCEGFRGGDVDRMTQEVGQSGGRRAHHLIHDLTYRADGQIIELKFLFRCLVSHQDIHDHLDVALFQQHDVAAFQTGHIADLDADRRLQIADAEVLHRNHVDRGGGDIHPVVQHIGYRGCRGPQADVHDFTDGVQFHRIKGVLSHAPHFSSLVWT